MRYAIVTGISRGLGEALVNQLLSRRDTVVVGLGRHFSDAQRIAAAERRLTPSGGTAGPQLVLRECDLAELSTVPRRDELRELLRDATEVSLVHNAAVVNPIGPIGELDPDEISRSVTVNFTAPLLLTNEVVAALPDGLRRLRLLFISSGAAHRVVDGWSVYGATKRGGEEFFSHLAAQATEVERVTVKSVNPGVMDTDMQAEIRSAHFAGQERFHQLHADGELPDPASIASKIINEHLTA